MESWAARSFLLSLSQHLLPMTAIDEVLSSLTDRRAAVSVVFRLRASQMVSVSLLPQDLMGRLRSLLTSSSFESAQLDLLYIKRTERVSDRWSGHIAFPGGNAKPDEKEVDCAVRETFEEVGIDLSDESQFLLLGAAKIHRTARVLTRHFVRPLVWLSFAPQEPRLALDPREVFAAFWVPIASFRQVESLPVLAALEPPVWEEWLRILALQQGVTSFSYPGLRLRPKQVFFSSELAPPAKLDGIIYNLWGVTLDLTVHLLQLGGLSGCEELHQLVNVRTDPLFQLWQGASPENARSLELAARL